MQNENYSSAQPFLSWLSPLLITKQNKYTYIKQKMYIKIAISWYVNQLIRALFSERDSWWGANFIVSGNNNKTQDNVQINLTSILPQTIDPSIKEPIHMLCFWNGNFITWGISSFNDFLYLALLLFHVPFALLS